MVKPELLTDKVIRGFNLASREYCFSTPEAKERFQRATVKETGSIVLNELEAISRTIGALAIKLDVIPRSKYRPDMLIEPMRRYFSGGVMGKYDKAKLHEAYRRTARMFYVGKLKPLPLKEVSYRGSRSSGAPTFTRKSEVFDEAIREAKRIRRGMSPPPLTVYHRGKDEDVVRPVFGYPFSMTCMESRFFEPYQYEVQNHHNPYVGGRHYSTIAAEVNELRWSSTWVYQLDYSGFDGSISSELIGYAFAVLKENFVMEERDEKDWEIICKYFVTAPMLMPDSKMIFGRRHGVPSGSMFTQLVDSIVNSICIEYVRLSTDINITRYHVLGDDSLVGVCGRQIKLNEISQKMEELGVKLNLKKSRIEKAKSTSHYFLGHYWHEMVMSRSEKETWEKVLTPERVDFNLFSKDVRIRYKAYISRLYEYQDDNPRCFRKLQLVIDALRRRLNESRQLIFQFESPTDTHERTNWDLTRFQYAKVKFSKRYRRVMLYLL